MNCENCGKKIPKARLDAVPGTQYCVKCAAEYGPQKVVEVDVAKASTSARNGFASDD